MLQAAKRAGAATVHPLSISPPASERISPPASERPGILVIAIAPWRSMMALGLVSNSVTRS
jgi:hypothetical protein